MNKAAWLGAGVITLFSAAPWVNAASAQSANGAYPDHPPADFCGGGPGDPPLLTFEPGVATPSLANPTVANRVARWGERMRSADSRVILLTGLADMGEAGYTPELGLRRAQAVRDLLVAMKVDPSAIWLRGQSVPTPASPDDAVLGRRVMVDDPLRRVACNQALRQDRFRWFIAHCSGQAVDAVVQRTCDAADEQLSGGDPHGEKRR